MSDCYIACNHSSLIHTYINTYVHICGYTEIITNSKYSQFNEKLLPLGLTPIMTKYTLVLGMLNSYRLITLYYSTINTVFYQLLLQHNRKRRQEKTLENLAD